MLGAAATVFLAQTARRTDMADGAPQVCYAAATLFSKPAAVQPTSYCCSGYGRMSRTLAESLTWPGGQTRTKRGHCTRTRHGQHCCSILRRTADCNGSTASELWPTSPRPTARAMLRKGRTHNLASALTPFQSPRSLILFSKEKGKLDCRLVGWRCWGMGNCEPVVF